jgi:hypothetical protein
MTVTEQIIEWAKANYNNSYAAQCVIEAWDSDDERFDKYTSLEDFKVNMVAVLDDHYDDMRAEVF